MSSASSYKNQKTRWPLGVLLASPYHLQTKQLGLRRCHDLTKLGRQPLIGPLPCLPVGGVLLRRPFAPLTKTTDAWSGTLFVFLSPSSSWPETWHVRAPITGIWGFLHGDPLKSSVAKVVLDLRTQESEIGLQGSVEGLRWGHKRLVNERPKNHLCLS